MKNQIVFRTKSYFHRSYVKKQILLHGELVERGTGDFYIFDGSKWVSTNESLGRRILEPSGVVEFLETYGNLKPIPDSEWENIDRQIENDTYEYEKPLNVGEYLETI